MNFPITERGLPMTANAAPAELDMGEGAPFITDIGVYNPGPYTVFVLASKTAGKQADATCVPLGPKAFSIYGKREARYLSAHCPDGAQPLVVFTGEGG